MHTRSWTVGGTGRARNRSGIQMPLGPHGAQQVQYLNFGQGTAHHALVVGKIGSESPSPEELFSKTLREGPDLGIHSIIWCDTYTNFQRRLDYQTLRDFDMRVVFQRSKDNGINPVW